MSYFVLWVDDNGFRMCEVAGAKALDSLLQEIGRNGKRKLVFGTKFPEYLTFREGFDEIYVISGCLVTPAPKTVVTRWEVK